MTILVGVASVLATIAGGLVVGAAVGHGAEPFQTVPEFLLFSAGVGMQLAFPLVVIAAAYLAVCAAIFRMSRDEIARAVRVAVVLNVIGLPIIAAWAAAHAISHIAHPNFGLTEGKPAWSMSPVFGVVGSLWVLLAIGAMMFLLAVDVARELRRRDEVQRGIACNQCGYLLIGCSSRRCPECGQPRNI